MDTNPTQEAVNRNCENLAAERVEMAANDGEYALTLAEARQLTADLLLEELPECSDEEAAWATAVLAP